MVNKHKSNSYSRFIRESDNRDWERDVQSWTSWCKLYRSMQANYDKLVCPESIIKIQERCLNTIREIEARWPKKLGPFEA